MMPNLNLLVIQCSSKAVMRSEIPGNITGIVGGIPRCDITASIITVLEEVLGMPWWHDPLLMPWLYPDDALVVVVSEEEEDDDTDGGITSAHRIT